MSISDFNYSKSTLRLTPQPTFAAFIMCAARRAHQEQYVKLKELFPDIIAELEQRNAAPGGILEYEAATLPQGHPIRKHYESLRGKK